MLQRLYKIVRFRALLVLLLLHIGLASGIYGLVEAKNTGLPGHAFLLLASGIFGMYCGFLGAFFFIVLPALPWIERARRISNWKSFLTEELPEWIETLSTLMPVALELLATARELFTVLSGVQAPKSGSKRKRARTRQPNLKKAA